MAVTLDELRQRLAEEQTQLLRDLEELKSSTPSPGEFREGSPFGKREEGATEAFELEKRLALERSVKELLGEVQHSLRKFDLGTYGICDICGQPIDIARLEVLPQASLCLTCKERQAKSGRSISPSK